MNAIQIKNHLDDFDKHYPFRKLFLLFGILPTAIFFPINFFFNPNINPIVKDSPIILGFGVLAFIAMFLVLSIGGLFLVRMSVEGYLAYGRFNANSMLVNDQAPREFSRRTEKYLFDGLRSRFEPIFEEIKVGLRREFNENRKESDKLFMDEYKKVNLELQTERDLRKQEQIKNNQLETKITNLELKVKSLEDWKSEQEQKISKKAHTQNNTENTKSLDDSNKIEFLDE